MLNVNDFGAVADWNGSTGTDNTTAFQAAIAQAIANWKASQTNYMIYGEGAYLVAGALQTTDNCYSQLTIPANALSSMKVVFGFVGPAPEGYVPDDYTSPQPGGFRIVSNLTGCTYSSSRLPSILGAAGKFDRLTATINNTLPIIQNVVFETPSNPTLGCLNFLNCESAYVSHCRFQTADDMDHMTVPTNYTALAVVMPGFNNNNYCVLDHCFATGYYGAFGVSEHSAGTHLKGNKNVVLLFPSTLDGSPSPIALGYVATVNCKYLLSGIDPSSGVTGPTTGNGKHIIQIVQAEMEDGSTPWDVVYHIKDSGNAFSGRINFSREIAGSQQSGALTLSGATGLTLTNLYA